MKHSSSSNRQRFPSWRAPDRGCTGLGSELRITYHRNRHPRSCILGGVRSNRRRGNGLTHQRRRDDGFVPDRPGGHDPASTHSGLSGPQP